MKQILCMICLLFGCCMPYMIVSAADTTTEMVETVSAEEEKESSVGETLMVLGIFTVTTAATAGVIIHSRLKRAKKGK